MNDYKIYAHINKINRKKYIGQTKQSLKKRWGAKGQRYKGQAFYNAIQKYGWDNFEHILILDNLTQEQTNHYEQIFIKKYQTTNKNFGYNVTEGGNSNTLNDEQKELRRELNYQMWEDGTFKELINTPVYCIELEQSFESALEAERQTKIDNSAIQKVCKGKLNYTGIKNGQPLHWIYLKDYNEDKIKALKNKSEILKGVSIPVQCVELNRIFNSATEASKELNISAPSIRRVVRGKQKTAGGFHWIDKKELLNIGEFANQ